MFKDTPYRRQPNLPKPEPVDSGHEAAWIEMKRRDIATKAMAAVLTDAENLVAMTEVAQQRGVTTNEFIALVMFGIADAMMAEAQRSPEQRIAIFEEWERKAKGGTP